MEYIRVEWGAAKYRHATLQTKQSKAQTVILLTPGISQKQKIASRLTYTQAPELTKIPTNPTAVPTQVPK